MAAPPTEPLNWQQWLQVNHAKLETDWERRFAKYVLARVPALDPALVSPQRSIATVEGRTYRVDFAIESAGLRLAIELDGYDKRGTGRGQSAEDFRNQTERDTSLVRSGWRIVRFSNNQVSTPLLREQCIAAVRAEIAAGMTREHTINHPALAEIQPIHRTRKRLYRYLFAISTPILLLVLTLMLTSTPPTDCNDPGSWAHASRWIGQEVAITGPVVQVYTDAESSFTFVNLGAAYPSANRVSLLVTADHATELAPAISSLEGRDVCVRGLLQVYQGAPEIVLTTPDQITILD